MLKFNVKSFLYTYYAMLLIRDVTKMLLSTKLNVLVVAY